MYKSLWIILTVITAALVFGNPASLSWPIKCPLFWLTGWQCPLCGMQRMVHEIFHLNLVAAYIYNKVLLLTLPYWVILTLGQLVPHWRTNRIVQFCYRNTILIPMLLLMLAWGILRNLY